ncbi:DNA-binding transcriptional regulator, XRE-family HTH domain [Pseudonocardia thermophila]|uniref:DNA-binding transcriptional regulator, XRE-family HTH domain n=1 Tax=Pseudonocardia thermophila TaxID=1848 RepID=A0A1M7AVF5_PSETH|nr:helix-turn-helix transcriptional regulator [Pseudonocardia thermophila]SHL46685.1 DNA-binding transcriptional regulator, XRE-family HTH domain [Pseudonocardia thermophila]
MPSLPPHGRARGDIVRAVRVVRRRGQRDLATASRIDASYLSRVEAGSRRLSPAYTDLVARALDVDPAVLCGQVPVIRTLRTALNLSADKLAHDIGVSRDRLDQLERGLAEPTALETRRLARRLGVEASVFHMTQLAEQAS